MGRDRTKARMLGTLAVAGCVVVVLVLWNPPGSESHEAAPPEVATQPQRLAQHADEAPVLDDVDLSVIQNQVLAEAGSINSWHHRVAEFLEDEQQGIQGIMAEDFEATLEMLADWETNYRNLTFQSIEVSPNPTLPGSAQLILASRRFAKLLEETAGGVTAEQAEALRERLAADLEQYQRLVDEGQSLNPFAGRGSVLHVPSIPPEELITPLSMRVQATILMIGQRQVVDALPTVIRSVDVYDEHVNWSVAGYTTDRLLQAAEANRTLTPEQAAAFGRYTAWREEVGRSSDFFDYGLVEFPSYRSAARPFERATSIGAPIDDSLGTVTMQVPPQFPMFLTSPEQNDGELYLDLSGESAKAKQVVKFAREFLDASPD